MRALLDALGNPQDSLKVVHVAGTNGKGAVTAMLDAVLRAAGYRVCRYTSPHLVSLAERFFVDGAPASAELLDAAAEAEERAAAAEAELEEVRAGGTGEADPAWKVLKVALTRFMADVEMLPLDPAELLAERSRVEANLTRLEAWTRQMRQALFSALPGEGAVV